MQKLLDSGLCWVFESLNSLTRFILCGGFSDVKLLNSIGVVVDFAANTSMGKTTSL
jgi:hypothetical protein